MTRNTTSQQTSRNLPRLKPRMDKERDTREAIIEDAGETEDNGRDLVHGDGGTIDLPTKPGDLSKDDQATPQAAYLDDTILPVFPDVLNPVHATSPGT